MSMCDGVKPGTWVKDDTDGKLDELADLCEFWKRHREAGRTPRAIQSAVMMLVEQLHLTIPTRVATDIPFFWFNGRWCRSGDTVMYQEETAIVYAIGGDRIRIDGMSNGSWDVVKGIKFRTGRFIDGEVYLKV